MLGSALNLGLTERLNNLGNGNFVNTQKPRGHAPVKELSQAIIQGFQQQKPICPKKIRIFSKVLALFLGLHPERSKYTDLKYYNYLIQLELAYTRYISQWLLQNFNSCYSQGGINLEHRRRRNWKQERHAILRTSQVLFLHLEKEFLLISGKFCNKNTTITGDSISWEIS